MDLRIGIAILAPLGLAACGARVDDPANLPRLGQWQVTQMIDGVRVNSLSIDRSQWPAQLVSGAHEGTESRCMEPSLRTREEVSAVLKDKSEGRCDIDTLDAQYGSFSARGHCQPKTVRGLVLSDTILGEGTMSASEGIFRTTEAIRIDEKTGASSLVTIDYSVRYHRTGDC